ncbi:unnamed protein product [Gemmata massiliana]|uniref:Uncharacterized protein n=1 Tax=Gemmata massiliana TaxID=1210884 RepID=A0A6P2D5C0_9BACT|nr:unnamed protein product [Gemmata massiliana]
MEDLNRVGVLLVALLLVWIAAPAGVAEVKGYDAGRWFWACGLVGVVVLAFLPRLRPGRPDADRWRAVGQRAGAVLSGVQLAVFAAACAWAARPSR